MPWMTISFERDGREETKIERVREAFEFLFMVSAAPEGAALFVDPAPYPSPVRMYFSPRAANLAADLIKLNHGSPSEEPDWRLLVLLVARPLDSGPAVS